MMVQGISPVLIWAINVAYVSFTGFPACRNRQITRQMRRKAKKAAGSPDRIRIRNHVMLSAASLSIYLSSSGSFSPELPSGFAGRSAGPVSEGVRVPSPASSEDASGS